MKPTLAHIQDTKTPQCQALIKHMRKQWITPLEALKMFNIFRLSSRINELRKVYMIEYKWVKTVYNKRVKAWRLAK